MLREWTRTIGVENEGAMRDQKPRFWDVSMARVRPFRERMEDRSLYSAYWLFFVFLMDLGFKGVRFEGVLGYVISGCTKIAVTSCI